MNFCHTCHSLYIRSNFYALCVLYTQHTVQKSTAHNKAVKSFSVTVFLRLLYYYYHRHHHYLFFGTILLPLPYFQVLFFFIFQWNTIQPSPLFFSTYSPSPPSSSQFAHLVCIIKVTTVFALLASM